MFDTYEPLLKVPMKSFVFIPKRYEIWINGKMEKSGISTNPIIATKTIQNSKDKTEVIISDLSLHKELAYSNVFDDFITINDRMQLIIVPAKPNVSCMYISTMLDLLGPTREFKSFNNNEPYCCSLFTINGKIAKITFSFCSPEKLIEFYS